MSVVSQPRVDSRSLVEILDVMPVTDIVYHDLRYTEPLVTELVKRLRRVRQAGRVLIVAPNAMLPHVLLELGYEVDLWHVPEGTLTSELHRRVVLAGPLDELLAREAPKPTYDVIVLPYVLERTVEHPAAVLARLRGWLNPGGQLLVAYWQVGALQNRLRAARGRSIVADQELRSTSVSFSWPAIPARRTFGYEELRAWSARNGLRMKDEALVIDKRATLTAGMTLAEWSRAQVAHAVKRAVPGLRDCGVVTLALHPIHPGPAEASAFKQRPFVTVIVSSESHSPQDLLADLQEQTYPRDRYDVILLISRSPAAGLAGIPVRAVNCQLPMGPRASNTAIGLARGDIIAFTDDSCRVPPGWLAAGVSSMAAWTVAVTGDVLPDRQTGWRYFLNLPGARQTERGERLFLAANTFYRKDAVLEAGGFDESFESDGHPGWGWDTELAYRLEQMGYQLRFEESVFVTRRFPAPPFGRWVTEEFRRARAMAVGLQRTPALATSLLKGGVFASKRTMYFDLMLAGLALAAITHRRRFLVLALPWITDAARHVDCWPPSGWGRSANHLAEMMARHGTWLAGFVAGSIKSRRLVL